MKLYKTAQLAPVSTNDLPAIQGWLQSMAGQGLLLDACDNATFFFNRESPVQRRYRIDPSKGNTMGVTNILQHMSDYQNGDERINDLANKLLQTQQNNIEQMKPYL